MKVQVDGKRVEGERMAFELLDEPWTKCKLPDGTILRLKLIVSDVFRLPGQQPGAEPVYLVKSSNVLAVDAPDTTGEVH